VPSRKWFAARVVALTGLATLVATSGAWTREATIMAITLVSAAALAYLLPNDSGDGEGERGLTLVEVLLVLLIVIVVLILIGAVR
jgi:hypothetical protein